MSTDSKNYMTIDENKMHMSSKGKKNNHPRQYMEDSINRAVIEDGNLKVRFVEKWREYEPCTPNFL